MVAGDRVKRWDLVCRRHRDFPFSPCDAKQPWHATSSLGSFHEDRYHPESVCCDEVTRVSRQGDELF